MKVKVLGIQPGTVTPGMTNEEYVDRQIEYMEELVEKENPYLVAFPEMMTGIYFGMVREKKWFSCAEDFLTGPTTTRMLAEAKKLNIHIAYSLFEKAFEDGKEVYYNTMGLVSPVRGVVGKYRKIHIPGGDLRYNPVYEKYYFNSGNILPVFELDNGIKVAMVICYDRSFPEVWRSYYLQGAQIIITATCTMGLRSDMFITELQTRALESHSFVIALNRAGDEQVEGEPEPRHHFGKSFIANPLGNIIVTPLGDEGWTYVASELDMDEVVYARGRLNWQRDRHPEVYGMVSDDNYAPKGLIFEKGF
ncbi:MAG: carbon-nitrogen hydrolase family protein [Lachnospiraceae bacterium]|nr:carbon-nitrogen hydrolase family protein [Candidatus Merdinaster equi]